MLRTGVASDVVLRAVGDAQCFDRSHPVEDGPDVVVGQQASGWSCERHGVEPGIFASVRSLLPRPATCRLASAEARSDAMRFSRMRRLALRLRRLAATRASTTRNPRRSSSAPRLDDRLVLVLERLPQHLDVLAP
jgi:hypothetical protein